MSFTWFLLGSLCCSHTPVIFQGFGKVRNFFSPPGIFSRIIFLKYISQLVEIFAPKSNAVFFLSQRSMSFRKLVGWRGVNLKTYYRVPGHFSTCKSETPHYLIKKMLNKLIQVHQAKFKLFGRTVYFLKYCQGEPIAAGKSLFKWGPVMCLGNFISHVAWYRVSGCLKIVQRKSTQIALKTTIITRFLARCRVTCYQHSIN